MPRKRPSKPAAADTTAGADSRHPATVILLAAYLQGAFPMASSRRGQVEFYTAPSRSIIPLEDGGLRQPRSLRQAVRSGRFTITTDACFKRTITLCADVPRADGGTWINDWIINTYTQLHADGHAHSIEAWLPIKGAPTRSDALPTDATHTLVGGLYGVHLGGAFFGESMFSRPDLGGTNASKVCLVHLWHHLRARGFALLDTQVANDHMQQFGITEVPHDDFVAKLHKAAAINARWSDAPATPVTPFILSTLHHER